MSLSHAILIYALFASNTLCQAKLRPVDLTLNTQSVGENVVSSVIQKIRFYLKEPSDFGLLRRIALVESDYGRRTSVLSKNPQGGIWQITVAIHNSLMLYESYSNISTLVENIRESFPLSCVLCGDIDYSTPMHSGLAAFVYTNMKFSEAEIPGTLVEQSRWWSQDYHQGGGVAQDFIDAAIRTEDERSCKENLDMDIWLLVDGSDSVTNQEFETVKNFSKNLKVAFGTPTSVRFGWSVYSFNHETVFKFSDQQIEFNATVSAATQPLGVSETSYALESVWGVMEAEKREGKILMLTVLVVITNSGGEDYVKQAAQKLHNSNILTIAVGIGDVDLERLQTISSAPSYLHSYVLSQYSELSSVFISELIRVVCDAPIPLENSGASLSASIRPGSDQHVKISLPSTEIVFLNITTDVEGAGNLVYASAISQNPNPALYDFEFHLHKGSLETDIKYQEFIQAYESVSFPNQLPLYLTISGSESRVIKTRLSSRSIETGQSKLSPQEASSTVLIVMLVAIALTGISGATFFAVRFYLSSTYYKKLLYEKESGRNMNDVLHTLTAIQQITQEVKLPYANMTSLNKLQDKLDVAEEMEIPREKLAESYNVLRSLQKTLDKLRTDLVNAVLEGKQNNANYQTMTKLEDLLYQGKSLNFPETELQQAQKVLHKLKAKIEPVSERLLRYTQHAKSPTATVSDMRRLEEHIHVAASLTFPAVTIFDACNALEHLQDRIIGVEKKIIKLTDEAKKVSTDDDLAESLDEELVLAEILHISNDVVGPAKQALSHLRSKTDSVKKELLQEIEEAKRPTATVRTIEKLKSSIMVAQQYNISVNFLKEPRDALKMLEDRLVEIKRLLHLASKEAEKEDAGFFELAKLQSMLELAVNTNISESDLISFRDVHGNLNERLLPITEALRKACDEAKLPSANIETMRELQEKINFAVKHRIGIDKLEEPRRLLRFLHKINESISQAKNELEAALKLCELHILTPLLNVVRNNKKQMLAWNPNDVYFKQILERAINSEKAMLQELEAKYRAKLDKLNPREKLEVLVDERDIDRYDLRSAKDNLRKFCGESLTTDDKNLIEKADSVFVTKTINHAVNILSTAIPSHVPKTVSAALEKAENLLKQDIPEANAQNDPRIVAACKKAEDALASAYALEKNEAEKLSAQKDELKNQIKSAISGDIDELRRAIKQFENEIGFSQTSEESNLIDQARKVIVNRLKEDLLQKFKKGLESREANDLKDALTSLDVALTQDLRQNDVDSDQSFESAVRTARSWYFTMLEFDRTKDAIHSLEPETISKLFTDDEPPSNICSIIQTVFLVLGKEVKDENMWLNIQQLFNELGENGLKNQITEHKVKEIGSDVADKAAALLREIKLEEIESTNPVAAGFYSWVMCVLEQIKIQQDVH